MTAIATHALTRTFKGGIEAVRGIDLEIGRGEVFGFLGPNGAGKTTTVRMLCTLLPPTSGEASVAGLDVVREAADVRRRIGVALQEIGLDPAQTGRELLELQCGLYGITGQSARERANELLDQFERADKLRVVPLVGELELGEQLVRHPQDEQPAALTIERGVAGVPLPAADRPAVGSGEMADLSEVMDRALDQEGVRDFVPEGAPGAALAVVGEVTAETTPHRFNVVGALAVRLPLVSCACGLVAPSTQSVEPTVAAAPESVVPGARATVWPPMVMLPTVAFVGEGSADTTPQTGGACS